MRQKTLLRCCLLVRALAMSRLASLKEWCRALVGLHHFSTVPTTAANCM